MSLDLNELEYTVEVNRLRLYARHGVGEQERRVGNLFEVTAGMQIPAVTAAGAFTDDSLADAANYAEIADAIRQQMEIPSQLLEHVAARIIGELQSRFPAATAIRVRIEKLTPPLGLQMAGAAVTLRWRRP